MLSNWYPVDTIENLKLNTRWDGVFHSSTYIFLLAALFIFWRHAHRQHPYWSTKLLVGTILIGFGAFNVVEGIIDHQLLGIHHVNELVPRDQWLAWDIGFIVWGAVMLIVGWTLKNAGQREAP